MECMAVTRIENIRVSENPDLHGGVAMLVDLVFRDGAVRIGLDAIALQKLRSALIVNPPPAPRSLGEN